VGLASVCDVRVFTLLVMAIAAGSLIELRTLTKRIGQPFIAPPAFAATFAYLFCAMLGLIERYESILLGVTIPIVLIWAMAGKVQGYLLRSAVTLLAVLYIGKLLSYFIMIRREPGIGAALTILVILLIVCTDTFAMLIGKRFGRRRLTSISPTKTVEGALGGLLAAVLAGTAVAVLQPVYHLSPWKGACLGFLTSLAAQLGDLVESAIKRDARMKDAGTALHGHGGVLDRFDSYLFGGVASYTALHFMYWLP
jgi:phosphatidate cytidylyltransferase